MSFLQLSIDIGARNPEPYEDALFELGALSVTLLDAADDPVLEPAPGAMPLWPTIVVRAVFAADADVDARCALRSARHPGSTRCWSRSRRSSKPWPIAPGSGSGSRTSGRCGSAGASGCARVASDPIPQVQRSRSTRGDPRTRPGSRLRHRHARHHRAVPRVARLGGRGAEGCDGWLAGADVIDYGCGSGILAIAALMLGAAQAIAMDIDPQALLATGQNAERNGVLDRVRVTADPRLRWRASRRPAGQHPGGTTHRTGAAAGGAHPARRAHRPERPVARAGRRRDSRLPPVV